MLSELNEAFDRAARDDDVRVIILAADGNHFSSGHDLRAGTDMSRHRPDRHLVLLRRRRRRGLHGDRGRDVRRAVLAVAQHPEADDRPGAGQGHRRRPDAGVADGPRRVLARTPPSPIRSWRSV